MKKSNYTINELIAWYKENTDFELNQDFLIYMVKNGILFPMGNASYSLDELNSFLLEKENKSFLENNGKLKVKESRKPLILQFQPKEEEKTEKVTMRYKITNLSGNKLKLIKLG